MSPTSPNCYFIFLHHYLSAISMFPPGHRQMELILHSNLTITTSYYTPTTQDTTLNNITIQFFSSNIKSVNSILHQMCKLHKMWLLHVMCLVHQIVCILHQYPLFYLFNRDAYKIYLGLCFCSFSVFWEFECRYLTLISIDWNRTKTSNAVE